PMKNVVATIVDAAEESGLPLNLGGGMRPGDPLEEFKRGFANRTEPFHTSEVVCDADAYRRLSAGHEAGEFFPTYRS
ncbi:MAG: GNAT family N-acetyltransferase, partial [Solirubrobacterales bacterium]